jgi:hypothetical protein
MSLPTAIERLNAHLIGFVRAYTFQLARRIEPQLPSEAADAPGHQAALQAARAIVRTARDKLDVRRMLAALEKHLAGLGPDDSEPFQRLLAELGDARHQTASQAAEPTPAAAEPAVAPAAVEPAAVEPPAAAAVPAEPDRTEPASAEPAAAAEASPVAAGTAAADLGASAPDAPVSEVEVEAAPVAEPVAKSAVAAASEESNEPSGAQPGDAAP